MRPSQYQWERDGRPEHLRQACEHSLKRLRLEQIPLYQLHKPDPKVPFADSIGALADLKAAGKIRHIGVSSVTEDQLQEAQRITPISSVQNRYNATDRSSQPTLDLCTIQRLAFIPWAPVQQTSANSAISAIAARHRTTAYRVVLAWLLAISPNILPIPGTGSPKHVEDNVAATSLGLTADEVAAITIGAPGCPNR